MQPATVTAKGQVTIPKAIREHLGLKPSAKVKFFIGHDGRVFVLPVRPISELRGMVNTTARLSASRKWTKGSLPRSSPGSSGRGRSDRPRHEHPRAFPDA